MRTNHRTRALVSTLVVVALLLVGVVALAARVGATYKGTMYGCPDEAVGCAADLTVVDQKQVNIACDSCNTTIDLKYCRFSNEDRAVSCASGKVRFSGTLSN